MQSKNRTQLTKNVINWTLHSAKDSEIRGPDIIAIDINGDRGINDVLRALNCVMHESETLPHLIIVKSRELYQSVKLQWQ